MRRLILSYTRRICPKTLFRMTHLKWKYVPRKRSTITDAAAQKLQLAKLCLPLYGGDILILRFPSVRPDLLVRSTTLLFVDGIKNPLTIMFNIISRSVARIFRVHTSKVKVTIRGQRFENMPVLCINQMASFDSQIIHIGIKAPWETCVFVENKL